MYINYTLTHIHTILKNMHYLNTYIHACMHTYNKLVSSITSIKWLILLLQYSSSYNQSAVTNARDISNIIAAMQGILFPAIFFYINPTVRKKWQVLLSAQYHRFCCCCPKIVRCISSLLVSFSSSPTGTASSTSMMGGRGQGEGGEEEDPSRLSEEWKTLNMHGVEEWKSRPDSMYALEDSFVSQTNSEAASSGGGGGGGSSLYSPWSSMGNTTSIRWQSSILTPSITASPMQVTDGVELTPHAMRAWSNHIHFLLLLTRLNVKYNLRQ